MVTEIERLGREVIDWVGSQLHHVPPGGDASRSGTYTVQPGDNLVRIATKLSVPGGWAALYDANRQTIGPDPRLIHPGQVLTLG